MAAPLATKGCCTAQDQFFFARYPQATTVVEGQSVTLHCETSRRSGLSYYWQMDGQVLPNTTRRHQRGSNLHITRVDREQDSGEFTCIARNVSTGFSLTSVAAALDIQWLGEPVLVQLQSPDSADKIAPNHDVVLRCHVDGSGEIRYEWFRNADRVGKSERLVLRGKKLHIKNATSADNGIYRCSAHSVAGSRNSSTNFALAVPDPNAAMIVLPPKNLLVRRGDSARFDCVYKDADFMEWYFEDSEPLENSSRVINFPNGSLVIHNVTENAEGLYTCVGAKGKESQSYTAQLKIAFLGDLSRDSFEPPLPDDHTRIVPEGAEFEMTCLPPQGDPPPRVWWQDTRGHTVSDTGPVRVDDTRLVVEAARPSEDNGTYTCVAENLAGMKTATFHLIVSIPPRMIADPQPVVVEEGETTTLRCQFEAMAYPVTSVRWLKDGVPIDEDRHRVKSHRHNRNSSLLVTNTHLSDRGQYTCEVNTTGFPPLRSKPAVLQVKEKLKFSPRPVNKKLELDSEARVYCRAQGSSPLVIRWAKSACKDCQPSFDLPPHIEDLNGTLIFRNVTMGDRGNYTCVATNSEGIINATIDIDVIVTPKFKVPPLSVTKAYEGFPVMIHCIADGFPKPTIKWDRNSNFSAFDQSRFEVLENGTLLVKEVHKSDGGKYGCTAGNSGGFKRIEVALVVESGEGYRPMEGLDEGSVMTKTVTITLSAAAAYMVLVIGLMIWCRYRRRRRKQAYLEANGAEGTNILLTKAENGEVLGEHTDLKETGFSKENKDAPRSDGGDTTHSHSSTQSKRSKNGYDRVSFPRQDLHSMVLLGRGEFGEVFLAKARGLKEGEEKDKDTVVMVKSLQHTRDESVLLEFKRELDMFHKLQHEHVAKLLGLCREAEPHYMLLEYSDWGDLKQFLLATRGGKETTRSKSPRPPQLSVTQIIQLASQVAQGMEHIANHRFIHKDLAARNCLIASNLTVKVSLVGLSKDTYSKEYCKHHNQIIPLRWLPYEAVFEDEYSTKSDVYMFGCLVWEMFHQGELPFAKMSDDAVKSALKKHELQLKPHKAAPQSLQTLLLSCWAKSPRDRPTFNELVVTISEISNDNEI
ncbi:inactive tyrosine-protein kinase 7 [Anabrus simplex]|uniref:inactive tyrosine-protein kinase 7 n=1 Tax=Anabrus simplex TaxID=316456 RepID=UPI0035A2CDB3